MRSRGRNITRPVAHHRRKKECEMERAWTTWNNDTLSLPRVTICQNVMHQTRFWIARRLPLISPCSTMRWDANRACPCDWRFHISPVVQFDASIQWRNEITNTIPNFTVWAKQKPQQQVDHLRNVDLITNSCLLYYLLRLILDILFNQTDMLCSSFFFIFRFRCFMFSYQKVISNGQNRDINIDIRILTI